MITLLAATVMSQTIGGGLRPTADRAHFELGTCVSSDLVKNNVDAGKYVEAIKSNVNLIEPENDLKPAAIWKGIDNYDFSKPDFLLGAPGKTGWAQAAKMKVRGHVLVYPNEPGYTTPGWLLQMESQLTANQTRDLLRNYIHTVAGRYKGKVYMWDVVNEAISDSPNGNQFNIRSSIWYRKLGIDFLPLCFKYAKEADPNAKLYYNDYGIEATGRKLDDAINLCNWIRSQGGQVDGIGLQYHISTWAKVVPGSGFYQAATKIETANYDWMITELDYAIDVQQFPQTDPNYGIVPLTVTDFRVQGVAYGEVMQLATSSARCKGVNMWGITDRHSWIPGFSGGKKGCALALNASYKPKPAVGYIQKALLSR